MGFSPKETIMMTPRTMRTGASRPTGSVVVTERRKIGWLS